MLWSKVLNEGVAFGSRCVPEPEGGGEATIKHDDAFETAREGRKVLGTGDVL
jgi:hypothetical protein